MTQHSFPFYNDAISETGAKLSDADGKFAEATLYGMLREQLPPEWGFIWGVHLGAHEYDFLVLVPGRGVVNVECKGHGYSVIGGTYKFQFYNKDTHEKENRDLLGQASKAQKYYIKYLQNALFGYRHWGIVGYCVVFPLDDFNGINFEGVPIYRKSDCAVGGKGLKAIVEDALDAAKRKLQEEFGVLNPTLLSHENADRIWRFWTQEEDKSNHEYELVRQNLDGYRREQEHMLSFKQLEILNVIANSNSTQFLVEGTAGTGKTFLALAAAAKTPGKVLFVCFNKVLASQIALVAPENPDVIFTHFHRLDEIEFEQSLKPQRLQGETDSQYWERVDAVFLAAFRGREPGTFRQYDAIIVDEAQDLTMTQLRCLMRIRTTGGKLMLFSDKGQTLYPNRLTKEILEKDIGALCRLELVANLRNPKTVSEYCSTIRSDENLAAAVLDGPEVAFRTIQRGRINDFLKKEVLARFNPCDVAVVAPFSELLDEVSVAAGTSFYGPGDSLSKTRKNLKAWHENRCAWKSTTHTFKGLEAMAVVHLVPSGYGEKNVLYVGGSRATYQLYIVTVEPATTQN